MCTYVCVLQGCANTLAQLLNDTRDDMVCSFQELRGIQSDVSHAATCIDNFNVHKAFFRNANDAVEDTKASIQHLVKQLHSIDFIAFRAFARESDTHKATQLVNGVFSCRLLRRMWLVGWMLKHEFLTKDTENCVLKWLDHLDKSATNPLEGVFIDTSCASTCAGGQRFWLALMAEGDEHCTTVSYMADNHGLIFSRCSLNPNPKPSTNNFYTFN